MSPGGFAFATAIAYRTSGTSERTAAVALGAGNAITLPGRELATVVLGP